MPNIEKLNQEERPLLKINDSFKKIIIVKDYIKRVRGENGIITMSIFDFLLDSDSLIINKFQSYSKKTPQ